MRVIEGDYLGENQEFDLSTETQLFEEEELEAAISSLEDSQSAEANPAESSEPSAVSLLSLPRPPSTQSSTLSPFAPSTRTTGQSPPVPPSGEIQEAQGQNQSSTNLYPELDGVEVAVCKVWKEDDERSGSTVLERIKNALSSAEDDWNPEGRPDAQGGMIGGSVALRVSSMETPLSKALQNQARYGTPLVRSTAAIAP